MNYEYSVRDPLGHAAHGPASMRPASEDAAQQLRRDGFQVLDLDEADGERTLPAATSPETT